MNAFLEMIDEMINIYEEKMLDEPEDLDELDIICPPLEDYSLVELKDMALNPFFGVDPVWGFYEKGMKSKEWLEKEKYTKIEEELILLHLHFFNVLDHEKQLDELLDMGLTVHPLKEDNCWGIFASTEEKAVKRYIKIKEKFPFTKSIKINCMEGDFGVDLYGELIY